MPPYGVFRLTIVNNKGQHNVPRGVIASTSEKTHMDHQPKEAKRRCKGSGLQPEILGIDKYVYYAYI